MGPPGHSLSLRGGKRIVTLAADLALSLHMLCWRLAEECENSLSRGEISPRNNGHCFSVDAAKIFMLTKDYSTFLFF